MRKIIKRYTLNENLTIQSLEENSFRRGGFMSNFPFPKYFYNEYLCDDIELHLEIVVNPDGTLYFDDIYSTYVIDDNFGQPYYPFYNVDADFEFLNKVIESYNKVMDKLIEKGILKELILENDKVKTKELTK